MPTKTRGVLALFLLFALAGTGVFAQSAETDSGGGGRAEPLPDGLENVGIDEKAGGLIPLGLEFVDENGAPVRLGDYFAEGRPVILNLGYYTCPMLCGLVWSGLVEGMQGIDWTPGEEFAVVVVSIDPTETPTLAKLKKQNYIREYGRPEAAAGWHFLTGGEENIRALAGAVGFRYGYNEDRREYVHAAGLFVATPDGRLSRVLYGIRYEAKTLRLSLVEASEGKIGSAFDKILLFCYHYDAGEGKYAPAAMNIMRGGGAIALVVLGLALLSLWRRDAGRKGKGE
ncbi:MAG: SCO family protein [Candidatus Eisenbacteria bacterium]